MVKEKTNWQEIKSIVIAAALLGFVFGFDDGSSVFNSIFWVKNLILQFVMSLIFLMIFVKITKAYSEGKGISTEFSLWSIKRYGLTRSTTFSGKGFPSWLIIPALTSVLSLGKLFFSAILCPKFIASKTGRVGKKWEKPTDRELALISLIGPITLTIIAIFITNISSSLASISIIPFSIAFSTMLPISRLNGTRVFMGAPALYIFSLAAIILSFYLSKVLTFGGSILLGVILSLILMSVFYILVYVKEQK
ncbi:hypothetical protein HOF78_00290 [Candidatus Woesearchaeota archaeon]|jgi:hypothetical protein|nr:hypothetical protein [Candidatus Woesearchaeota archaeon]MBT6044595.1 hypothetical protein [Candidatus Woesearchaeota archaeon]